jgi:hypothetical protein
MDTIKLEKVNLKTFVSCKILLVEIVFWEKYLED